MNRQPVILGNLKSGQTVIDRTYSHMVSHQDAFALLPEALPKIDARKNEPELKMTVNFGKIIGNTNCVETNENDEIFYAIRPPRKGLTRFVKNRKPIPCHTLVVSLSSVDQDTNIMYDPSKIYVLSTAYIGLPAVSEPTDPKYQKKHLSPELEEEHQKSVEFWDAHALIYDESTIDTSTITTQKPW